MKTVPSAASRPRRSQLFSTGPRIMLSLLAAGAAFLLPAPKSAAIPQTFTAPSPFVLQSGKPPEDFFSEPSAWQPGAAIPGAAGGASVESPGPVFGVNARSIKLVRASSGELQEAVVRYEIGAAHLTARDLHKQLEANLSAFFGAKASAE